MEQSHWFKLGEFWSALNPAPSIKRPLMADLRGKTLSILEVKTNVHDQLDHFPKESRTQSLRWRMLAVVGRGQVLRAMHLSLRATKARDALNLQQVKLVNQ